MGNMFDKCSLLIFLALFYFSCTTCNECPADLTARFRFVDTLRNEIYADPTLVSIEDLNGGLYALTRDALEEDTFYLVDFKPLALDMAKPDTVLAKQNGALIDTIFIHYTFSEDSDCCTNNLKVGRLDFAKSDAARRIKPNYSIYDIIVD